MRFERNCCLLSMILQLLEKQMLTFFELKYLHTNVDSISKFHFSAVGKHNPSVILISENWLDP